MYSGQEWSEPLRGRRNAPGQVECLVSLIGPGFDRTDSQTLRPGVFRQRSNKVSAEEFSCRAKVWCLKIVFVCFIFASPTAMASEPKNANEKLAHDRLSTPLKLFICTNNYNFPDWCAEFLRKIHHVSLPPKPDPKKETQEDIEARKAEEQARLAAKRLEEEIAKAEKIRQRLEAWKSFLREGNVANLSAGEVQLLNELSTLENYGEANEVLGYAYSIGSGVLAENQAKAYRQYGLAYLKGLARVKPNMDMIWKKLTKTEQQEALREFERNQ